MSYGSFVKGEYPGIVVTANDPVTCEYCQRPAREIATVQLLDRNGVERQHVVCAACNERIERGLAEGQRLKREEKERKAEERRRAKGGLPR